MDKPKTKYFGIFSKFLVSFLVLSLIPLAIFGVLTFLSIQSIGNKIVEDATLIVDQKTQKTLELQASTIAKNIEAFLRKCEFDLLKTSNEKLTASKFISIDKNIRSEIWIREKQDTNIIEKRYFIPVYKEISFIDLNGNELIKLKDSQILNKKALKNIRNPFNTTYKSEKYFEECTKLKKGEIYLSHLNGFYVTMQDQMQGETNIEKAVGGKIYNGVFRIGTPVYNGKEKIGILVFGIDHQHFMEFTQHVLPNSDLQTVFPSYRSGDYAFMFDDEGWIITHPKYWDIRGVDTLGNIIPPYSKESPSELVINGFIPFNLNYAGFIHENYPVVAQKILNMETGSVVTTNIGGIKKIMAFSPIFYNKGVYAKTGVFGGVTLGAEIAKFHTASQKISRDLKKALDFIAENVLLFILGTFLISLIVSYFLSKHFTEPIIKLTKFSKKVADGELDLSITTKREDEIGVLTTSFNKMTREIKKGRNQLLYSYNELQESQKNIEDYASNLEYQVKILKSIQSIGNILGSTLEINSVLKYILRTCVESVNFDRAILYLLDEEEKYLECKEMFGFTKDEEKQAAQSKYNIKNMACIETEVLKTGNIIFVEDFENYSKATEIDKKIRKISKSDSFVFVPLKVKEKNIGILGADKLRTKEAITDIDINSLQILANQAARVIENTILYKELVSQRNFVEDIISNMINGVISTNGKGFITSINKAGREILEIGNKKVVGQYLWSLVEDLEELMNPIRESLITTGIYKGYNIRVKLNDKEKYLNLNASRVYHNNIHTNTIIIFEDVTERKKIDEQLRNIDRLASLGRFAAGIAHEIRNPLTGLSLFLDDLHDSIAKDNKQYSTMITTALSEIERLDNLIKEILEFAVPSKGDLEKTDINSLIKSTLLLSEKQCQKLNIEIINNLSNSVPLIKLDPERIKQALLNLIVNSIHFMPNGGKLIITSNFISKENVIELKVEDTGRGFNKAEIQSIFDPFYTNRDGGTGLGLAITYSIISEHGGTIIASNR